MVKAVKTRQNAQPNVDQRQEPDMGWVGRKDQLGLLTWDDEKVRPVRAIL